MSNRRRKKRARAARTRAAEASTTKAREARAQAAAQVKGQAAASATSLPRAAPPAAAASAPAPAAAPPPAAAAVPAPTAAVAPARAPSPAPAAPRVSAEIAVAETPVAATTATPARVPRVTFWLGAMIGLCAGLPLVCVALVVLARAGIGDPTQPPVRLARLALVFAALPAFVTGGGVARLAAYRALGAPIGQVGPRLMRAAVPAMAAGGAALAYLVAVPLGGLPDTRGPWALVGVAGAIGGALCGGLVALAVWQRLLYSKT